MREISNRKVFKPTPGQILDIPPRILYIFSFFYMFGGVIKDLIITNSLCVHKYSITLFMNTVSHHHSVHNNRGG